MKNVLLVLVLVLVLGCPSPPAGKTVTVYCAADRECAEGIFQDFEKETGIHVDAKWDTEAAKTTGLGQAIAAEQARPRCDVFWDNELLQTLLLAKQGDLAPLPAEVAGRGPVHGECWIGFAARARVLLVNTAVVATGDRPRSVRDLADARWKGRAGMANPLFGTTQDHVAALVANLGEDAGKKLLAAFRENEVAVCAGNADVKNRVSSGELAFGLTDTDDASEAVVAGKPVAIVFPDQDGLGTLLLPNALSVVTGAPHPAEAAALVNWLASAKGEEPLARGPGVHLPLLGAGPRPTIFPADLKSMTVSWEDVARAAPAAREAVQKILLAAR
jgi:iron(III) transport system substrate-binding protein